MLRKIMQSALALTVVLGIAASAPQPAEARRGGIVAGVAVGTLLGLGIAGAYAGYPRYYRPRYYSYSGYGGDCYPGPRRCNWVGRNCWTNNFGEHVCRGGSYRCWRPTVCD